MHFSMALCLCGIGVLEPDRKEHPTTAWTGQVHQRCQDPFYGVTPNQDWRPAQPSFLLPLSKSIQ